MKKQAFTLIELMVVIAIIAILATLSVTSFSAAIRRTRNAGRQADVTAVAKSLETCYDVSTGTYTTLPATATGTWIPVTTAAAGPFLSGEDDNSCLNDDIIPGIANYPYGYKAIGALPQSFAICAQLEEVDNWESVGNVEGLAAGGPDVTCTATAGCVINTPCYDDSTVCYFCSINQQ